MGTICILLGIIILIAFTAVGFFASNAILSNELYMSLLGITNAGVVYGVIVGACALIGLLICLTLAMNGLIYNRVCKNTAEIKKIARRSK